MKNLSILLIVCIVLIGKVTESPAFIKSIARTEDPVIVLGERVKDLMGSCPGNLSLMKYQDGEYHPVPFQIDERHEDGSLVFPNGRIASTDSNPLFDANDELIFMANDLGDKAPSKKWPQGVDTGMEILVVDPVTNSTGWVYFFKFPKNPPRSRVDYVKLEFAPNKEYLTIKQTDANGENIFFLKHYGHQINANELRRFLPNGKLNVDMLDRVKVRIKLKLGFLPAINIPADELLKGELAGFIDGPIRMIGKADTYIKFAFIKIKMDGIIQETFYRNCLNVNLRFKIPESPFFNSSTFLKKGTILGYLDFNENIIGHQVYSKCNPHPSNIFLDGNISAHEEQLNYMDDSSWITGYGPMACIIGRLFLPKEWGEVHVRFHLNENLNTPEKPEEEKGEIAVGWNIKGGENVANTKISEFDFYIYTFTEDFRPPMEKPVIDILDNPLKVKCLEVNQNIASK